MQYVRISHLLNSYSKEIRAQHITRETTNCCCCYIVSLVSHVVSSPGLDLIRYEVIGSCINLSMNVHKKSVSVIIRHKISSPSYPPFCCMNPCTCSSQRWSMCVFVSWPACFVWFSFKHILSEGAFQVWSFSQTDLFMLHLHLNPFPFTRLLPTGERRGRHQVSAANDNIFAAVAL